MVLSAIIKVVSGRWSAWEGRARKKTLIDKVPCEQRPEKVKSIKDIKSVLGKENSREKGACLECLRNNEASVARLEEENKKWWQRLLGLAHCKDSRFYPSKISICWNVLNKGVTPLSLKGTLARVQNRFRGKTRVEELGSLIRTLYFNNLVRRWTRVIEICGYRFWYISQI